MEAAAVVAVVASWMRMRWPEVDCSAVGCRSFVVVAEAASEAVVIA
jgi:hypothetical protein